MGNSLCKTGFTRQSPFGFACSRCLGCCRFKKIQLNPYEIARLADNRDLTTTAFIDRYTTTGGTILQANPEGSCVFLDAEGCAVHPDRPLVCRLYPLGRFVDYLGVETFAQVALEEGCQGALHENGAVIQYLEEQRALPFMHAADRYLDLLWHLMETLKEQELAPAQSEAVLAAVRAVGDGGDGPEAAWVDMDRAVADYCRRSNLPVPEGINDKMAMHIKAVREWSAYP